MSKNPKEEEKRKNEEIKIFQNQRDRNMEKRQLEREQDRAAKEKILEAMKQPNSSNQMEHNIKIYNVEKNNKHESGVIFEDVKKEKKYLLENIQFAQRIFEGLIKGGSFNSNTEIIVKGNDYLNLILALQKNAILLE